jgi:hypothetical protein
MIASTPRRQPHRHQVLQRVEQVGQALVGLDDQQVARLSRLLEQQRRHLQHRHRQVRRHGQPALAARLQPPGGERDQQVAHDRHEQTVEGDPDREQDIHVGRAQLRGEPREAGRDHQQPGAVRRAPPPGEQAGAEKRPADQQRERGVDAAGVDVAAAQDHRHDGRPGEHAGCGDRREGYSPTARFGASPQSCSSR